jgi:subtilase family serine protease
MQSFVGAPGKKWLFLAGWLTAFSLIPVTSLAQTPAERIAAEIDNSARAMIKGTHPPMARPENDAGRLTSDIKLHGINIVFSRSAVQEADLQALIAAQQDPVSSLYHEWLTPDQFAARFGVADADIAKIEFWLQQQGFSIESVSRSKNRITFSGTVEQTESAFSTEFHYYNVSGKKYYAPSADVSVPSALSLVVQSVANLSTFRPKSHVIFRPQGPSATANFTSSVSGNNFLTPKDIATIYDINAAYNGGYIGTGQSIAVVGQSLIAESDIENFQSALGLAKKDPTLALVPNSGTAAVSSGDEAESDLDLEYSGAIAKGATIYFVYVGNSSNYSVWDSIVYAVDNRIAPVISTSYGTCESGLASSDYATLNAVLAQAASQGQSVVAAAGDHGSTDCYGETGLTTAQQEALAVDFPASSQYATGMGGSEFPAADVAKGNTTYWTAQGSSDIISSALSYIPEQAWNDDSSTNGLASGGGGVSSFTARPSWQAGVTGIPSGNFRLVPDVSLTASPANAGFLYCTSDTSAWTTGQAASCNSGFRDSSSQDLTVAGGTSFDVPTFAGMVAIINQKLNSSGQGVVNSTLYALAADSTTYASAFHDITSGNNECTAGSSVCSTAGTSEYPATTGYDEATGLGSLDFYNLLLAWPTSTSSLTASTTTLSAATTTPASGASDVITITVGSGSSSFTTAPTGTLTIVVDGTTATSSLALSGGSATYTFSSTTSGSHAITATYSGDSTYAPSTGTLTLTVGASSGSFTLAATNVTVSAGSSASSTITITPLNGYTGTIGWTLSTSPSISNSCYTIANATVSGANAVSAVLTIYTSSTACASVAVQRGSGKRKFLSKTPIAFLTNEIRLRSSGLNVTHGGMAMAGLLFIGLLGFRSRKFAAFAGVLLLAAVGFAASGCSGASSSSSTSTNATKGTYTLTIVGTDTSSSSTTTSTNMTLTID